MTEGQRLLRVGGDQAVIARLCGVTQQAVSKWLIVGAKGSRPAYAAREILARPPPEGLGIPMAAWDAPAELPRTG